MLIKKIWNLTNSNVQKSDTEDGKAESVSSNRTPTNLKDGTSNIGLEEVEVSKFAISTASLSTSNPNCKDNEYNSNLTAHKLDIKYKKAHKEESTANISSLDESGNPRLEVNQENIEEIDHKKKKSKKRKHQDEVTEEDIIDKVTEDENNDEETEQNTIDEETEQGKNQIGIKIEMNRMLSSFMLEYYMPCIAIVLVSQLSYVIPVTAIPGRVALLVTLFLTLVSLFIQVSISLN